MASWADLSIEALEFQMMRTINLSMSFVMLVSPSCFDNKNLYCFLKYKIVSCKVQGIAGISLKLRV